MKTASIRIFGSHLLTAIGVWLVSTGRLDETTSSEIIGAVSTLIGVGVSLFARYKTNKQNNQVLQDLTDLGVYSGKLDGILGPVARTAITQLADQTGE